ncbi:MAG: peptide ABC transporter substrate-binding protein, partial [Deltaproteobacteria bacterium]|nr:peptide ABC transporter substrate-binding protein [Deltaproteobacteria bacterium]
MRIPLMSGVPTLDPGLVEDVTSIEVVEQLFLGLTDFDPQSYEVVPELATSWNQNKDGTVYTFNLRDDAYWTNGEKVTAHDIVWALQRNIAPETQSPYANVLYPIKNAIEINKGKIDDLTSLGVKALDKYTIAFNLKAPIAYFPALAGLWTYRPLPIETVKKFGDDWILPKNIVSNGSYQLDSWERDNFLIFKKNLSYYDVNLVKIKEVRFFIVPEASRGLTMYENNELDLIGTRYLSLPLPEIPRIKSDPILKREYRSQPSLATYYLAFNNQRYPTDNPLVRKAIAAVIDKEMIVQKITKGS